GQERAREHRRVEAARAGPPQAQRQRALARAAVGLEVAHVVDDEDRTREQADWHGAHERLPGKLLHLHEVRARDGDDAEEQEHEHLTETLVSIRPRASRVEDAREY